MKEEENRRGQKRRRVDDSVDSQQLIIGVKAGTSTSASRASPSCSVPKTASGNESVTGNEYAMEAVTLRILLHMKDRRVLIVDCRDSNKFMERKINSACCLNVPIRLDSVDTSGDSGVRFDSFRAVVGFLQKYCSKFLVHLQAPDHYTNIVILDEVSTAQWCTQPVKLVFEAVMKWNENTKTSIHILQGGLEAFSKEFPNLVVAPDTSSPGIPDDLEETVSYSEMKKEGASLSCVKLTEKLICYLKNLDEIVDVTRRMINFRGIVKSLETVKSVLVKEFVKEEDKLRNLLERSIPEDIKCPVCFETFQGEIVQCGNGHSICSECCTDLTLCPECRVPYRGRVRNRALEKLLGNSLKVECVCGVKLELNQLQVHVTSCVKKMKGKELVVLDDEIEMKKKDLAELNLKLGNANKNVLDTEQLWNSWFNESEGAQLDPAVGKMFINYVSAKKSTICSLNKSLLSTIFC